MDWVPFELRPETDRDHDASREGGGAMGRNVAARIRNPTFRPGVGEGSTEVAGFDAKLLARTDAFGHLDHVVSDIKKA
jgi:hypothetical protein